MKRNIYNFKHIDKNISDETVKKYVEWYKYYHKLYICHQWKFKRLKRIKLALEMTSIGLTVGGTVAGALNPAILGTVAGPGILIQGYLIKSNLSEKLQQCRFAYTSYQKILSQIILERY